MSEPTENVQRVVVVGPNGIAVEGPDAPPDAASDQGDEDGAPLALPSWSSSPPWSCASGAWSSNCSRRSGQRLSTRRAGGGCARSIARSIAELEKGLAPELVDELERLSLPFTEDDVPSDAELRIAQAQLVGWLEGLFHGIQTAFFAQQMAARAQLEQMRRALPGGAPVDMPPGLRPGGTGTGQYL